VDLQSGQAGGSLLYCPLHLINVEHYFKLLYVGGMKREAAMRKRTSALRLTAVTLGILALIIAFTLSGCGSTETTAGPETRTDGAKGNTNLVTVYKPFG
jgi:hypothetical protein